MEDKKDWAVALEDLLTLCNPLPRKEYVSLDHSIGRVSCEDRGSLALKGKVITPAHILCLARMGIGRIAAFPIPKVQVVALKSRAPLASMAAAWIRGLGIDPGIPMIMEGPSFQGIARPFPWTREFTILIGGEETGDIPEAASIFSGLDVEAWAGVKAFSFEDGGLLIALPMNPMDAFTCFHVLVAPCLRRLKGETPGLETRKGPLRFSKVWPSGSTKFYPGRMEHDIGDFYILHLGEEDEHIKETDCIFVVPPNVWSRDGDIVDFIPI